MMKDKKLPLASPAWQRAASMLQKQACLADQLATVFESKPKSGLYKDEDDGDFEYFAQHVRRSLSLSPRTVLRAALNKGLARLTTESPLQVQTLHELLDLSSSPREPHMHRLVQSLASVCPGQCYSKLQHALQHLERHLATDPQTICAKVQAKHGSANCADLEAIWHKVLQKHQERTRHLEERVSRLQKELALDMEYAKHTAVITLWEGIGAKRLWERFLEVDLLLCRSRNHQGAKFESQQELVFAMIVQRLMAAANEEGAALSLSTDEFAYVCNMHWWHGQVAVGEIDLVVLQQGKVVAVCEMKSTCYLLSQAFRQHEHKILQCRNDPWATRIGPSSASLFQVSDRLEFFVATCAAAVTPSDSDHLLGAEPTLSTAIADGIRDQGITMANQSTEIKSAPLVDVLLGVEEKVLDEVISYLMSFSSNEKVAPSQDTLDFGRLAKFVEDRFADSRNCSLSPAGCLRRFQQSILIVEV
jgi:hypothetical protein